MKRILSIAGKSLASLLIAAIASGVAIKLYDRHLVRTRGVPAPKVDDRDWRELKVYPYTGHHMTSHARHVGPLPSENQEFYTDFDLSSGDHGFFVDFDLDQPPAKGADEFRILLVGGSGAQGWGARTNDDMVYRRIEAYLNEKISPDTGLRYSVINLAMAGFISYQNFIALNLWGHALEPDLILSFSGGNDTFMPIFTGSDTWLCWPGIASLNNGEHPDPPPLAEWLDRNLPGIATYTETKKFLGLRPVHPNLYCKFLQRKEYNVARGFDGKDAVFDIAMPTYVNALKSMKRDFQGIPMIVLFQAVDFRKAIPYINDEYLQMTDGVEEQLRHYVNDRWHFINFHKHWVEHGLFDEAVLFYGLHLTNKHQELVARETIEQVPPEFWQRSDNKKNDGDDSKKVAQQDNPNVPLDFWSWPMHGTMR